VGETAFDTSPYYGDSEEVMGKALWNLRKRHPRDSYMLITKCGRVSYDHFDYSASWVRQSVLRSLTRLRTGYLDAVLLHDAEFTSTEEVLEGVSEFQKLRSEGLVRAFGLSGYNLPILLSHAQAIQTQLGVTVEVLFSYCHFNLQNNLLAEYAPRFKAAGVKTIINGSPLSMGLLRAEPAPEWHPAAPALKAACVQASKHVEGVYGQKLADVALRYSLGFEGTTCSGCSSMEELDTALGAWEIVKSRKQNGEGNGKDEQIFRELWAILVGDHETVWPMPPLGFVRKPKG
jgi:D-arabinose 1-dehydrogenase